MEAEGVVEVKRNKGIQISQVTSKDFKEIHAMRMVLEPMILSKACELRSSEDIARARKSLQKLAKQAQKSPKAYLQQNIEFHFLLYRVADMPILFSTIKRLRVRVHPYVYQSVSARRDSNENIAVHEEMLEGFISQDCDLAVEALKRDLDEAAEILLSTWDEQGY